MNFHQAEASSITKYITAKKLTTNHILIFQYHTHRINNPTPSDLIWGMKKEITLVLLSTC